MAAILIIDDEEPIRQLLRIVLESARHHVIKAPNGRIGLAMYGDHPTDLVITDISMPERNGLELMEEMKRGVRDVKVLVISGAPGHEIEIAKRLGARQTLPNPLDINRLLDAVQNELAR